MEDKSSNLYKVRHSLAHVMAIAILDKYPNAKIVSGPPTETGFFYGIDFEDEKVSDKDLKDIQKRMKKIISADLPFVKEEKSKEELLEMYKDNKYKTEIIEDKSKESDTLTIYKTGEKFYDLCSGPHVDSTGQLPVDAFRIERVAGAYFKGDESREMLTRIYGLAFESKQDLDAYDELMREAAKRDHRKLGKELGLFTFSELVGPGLPLWTPKGGILRTEIDDYIWSLRQEKGYKKVAIPHITKEDLYKTSGHYDKFADELFKVKSREGKDYFLKPMNCPHHTQIFDAEPKSYKEMPQRYAETTTVYRDEQSGELAGLTRVLSITQDDAHVFCRENQVVEEVNAIWDIIDKFYSKFGFELKVRLSFHDPENFDNYLGTKENWEKSEAGIKEIAESRNMQYFVGIGEAAMYGPKLDFIAKDSLGRTHQVATIQLDRNLPERFDLNCINENGEKERVVMIHAAIAGSLERFIGVMIEHTAGAFPLTFSPTQISVIPVADSLNEKAEKLVDELKEKGFRVDYDPEGQFGKKVREAKKHKVPYFVIVGEKDDADKYTIESRDTGEAMQMTIDEILEKLTEENK